MRSVVWENASVNWIWIIREHWARMNLCQLLNYSKIHWCNALLTYSMRMEMVKWTLKSSYKVYHSSVWKATSYQSYVSHFAYTIWTTMATYRMANYFRWGEREREDDNNNRMHSTSNDKNQFIYSSLRFIFFFFSLPYQCMEWLGSENDGWQQSQRHPITANRR